MDLFVDDINQTYYWTDMNGNKISPSFDYEEDALQWKQQELDDNHFK